MTTAASSRPATAAAGYLAALDRFESEPGAVRLRQRTYQLLDLPPGGRVADVGCGTGRAAAELAGLGYAAVGVDADPAMIELARSRHPGGDYRVAAAEHLPFDDAGLAGYRADKVLHELADPMAALIEARRVLRPGGRVVIAGQDWDLIGVADDDPVLARTMVHARTDTLPSGLAARRAPAILADLGFADVVTEAHTAVITRLELAGAFLSGLAGAATAAGAVSPEQAERWLAAQDARAASGRLLVVVPILVTAAVRA